MLHWLFAQRANIGRECKLRLQSGLRLHLTPPSVYMY